MAGRFVFLCLLLSRFILLYIYTLVTYQDIVLQMFSSEFVFQVPSYYYLKNSGSAQTLRVGTNNLGWLGYRKHSLLWLRIRRSMSIVNLAFPAWQRLRCIIHNDLYCPSRVACFFAYSSVFCFSASSRPCSKTNTRKARGWVEPRLQRLLQPRVIETETLQNTCTTVPKWRKAVPKRLAGPHWV
jgi:hypothetical protein